MTQFDSYVGKELANVIGNVFTIRNSSSIILFDFINKTPDTFGRQ